VTLTVDGEIDRARSFTFAELRRLPGQIVIREPEDRAAVPLAAVVDPLSIKLWARYAIVRGADGFVANIPVEHVHDCILVYARAEQPLPRELGGPLRLVTRGLGHCANVKRVATITLSATAEPVDHVCEAGCVRSATVFPPRTSE
jgi:DMSO/TMAO reductase YedYZ molybdopterin-dependent catalytic subunit